MYKSTTSPVRSRPDSQQLPLQNQHLYPLHTQIPPQPQPWLSAQPRLDAVSYKVKQLLDTEFDRALLQPSNTGTLLSVSSRYCSAADSNIAPYEQVHDEWIVTPRARRDNPNYLFTFPKSRPSETVSLPQHPPANISLSNADNMTTTTETPTTSAGTSTSIAATSHSHAQAWTEEERSLNTQAGAARPRKSNENYPPDLLRRIDQTSVASSDSMLRHSHSSRMQLAGPGRPPRPANAAHESTGGSPALTSAARSSELPPPGVPLRPPPVAAAGQSVAGAGSATNSAFAYGWSPGPDGTLVQQHQQQKQQPKKQLGR